MYIDQIYMMQETMEKQLHNWYKEYRYRENGKYIVFGRFHEKFDNELSWKDFCEEWEKIRKIEEEVIFEECRVYRPDEMRSYVKDIRIPRDNANEHQREITDLLVSRFGIMIQKPIKARIVD